ncbi:hypothetical protein BDP55DRAFT_382098 [Colletotrichum godetiae]|uniref:Uncharacterized protein n=1 Tax=Colletotrichum godetiae TaxID=1209918 RepID=A0AAJ0AXD6_9PEZI|nr:uncharacterized protein BDP55DRAFT_382098 [Colletotrichum godetiae]KAK1689884.1 hypothetical protein BDP55DRAFT_382098 [Colletotrichum godetiae]
METGEEEPLRLFNRPLQSSPSQNGILFTRIHPFNPPTPSLGPPGSNGASNLELGASYLCPLETRPPDSVTAGRSDLPSLLFLDPDYPSPRDSFRSDSRARTSGRSLEG